MDIERLEELRKRLEYNSELEDEEIENLWELIDEAIARKTETTSCEWCEIASECEYEVTFFRDDDRRATRRSLMPKFCPNCGRRLEEQT